MQLLYQTGGSLGTTTLEPHEVLSFAATAPLPVKPLAVDPSTTLAYLKAVKNLYIAAHK